MSGKSIIWRIREQGLPCACFYYFCRAAFRIQRCIIGKTARRFGRLRKERIVFKNRQFQDYSDNTRALSDYLREHDPNGRYEIIWMVSDPKPFRSLETPKLKFVTAENRFGWSSPAACWYGATAGYFFYTHHSGGLNRFHCGGQVTVNLWHGCSYKANPDTGAQTGNRQQSAFDYALVPGPFFIRSKSVYWNCDAKKILPIGYPRYDWMLHPCHDRETICSLLGFPADDIAALVLWLPTFRKSAQWDYAENSMQLSWILPGVRDTDELYRLDRFCKERKILLIVKPHPLEQFQKMPAVGHIRFLPDTELVKTGLQLQELLAASNALVSDYSSAAVDYLLLDRPIGFVLADYEKYSAARGFVVEDPLAYMPGEKIRDLDALEAFLAHTADGLDLFAGQRRQLMPELHNRTDSYCARILNDLSIEI